MTRPREIRLYPLWLLAGLSASFGIAYVLPHPAVSLGGGLLLVAPALLVAALLRPATERPFWLQAATLALFMVPPLWAGIGGMAGVHLVAGLSAVMTGLLFWSLRGTRLSTGGRSTATSVALCGVALLAWAGYAPLSSQIGAARSVAAGPVPLVVTDTVPTLRTIVTNDSARFTQNRWAAYSQRIVQEQARAAARWEASNLRMDEARAQASRKMDAYDRLIEKVPAGTDPHWLEDARALAQTQAEDALERLGQQQSLWQAQSEDRVARLEEEQRQTPADVESSVPRL